MTTRVHRVEVLIVDTDGVGADGVRDLLECTRYPNRAISPCVMSVETREVEWSDEHPLNHTATQESAYRALFGLDAAAELLAARAALAAADALAKAVREDDDACRGGSSAPSLAVMDALALYRAARGAR